MNFCRLLISGIPLECQTVWIQIRSDVLSDFIWIQSVCKGNQQTTLVDKELKLFPFTGSNSVSISCILITDNYSVLVYMNPFPACVLYKFQIHILIWRPWIMVKSHLILAYMGKCLIFTRNIKIFFCPAA